MLEMVYSPDWNALSAFACGRIVADGKKELGGRIWIVPEQFSFETERSLCAAGGARISRYAEVLSFSRLADRALAVCGGIARPTADQGGRIMALGAAVEQVRSKLQFFARSARKADFLMQLLSMVDELKTCRMGSEQLYAAAEKLEGALAVKTGELALLLEAYEAICAHGAQDPRDRLELLCDHIAQRGFGKDYHIYVDGFFGFTAIELEILGAFLAQGTPVTVCLCCDGLFHGAQVFADVRRAAGNLMHQAERSGAEIRQMALPASTHPISAVALSAFTGKKEESAPGLCLYPCQTSSEEARAICGEILSHVRSGGRYRDITVACADQEALSPILEAEFARCGIPAFFAGKTPALRTPILSAVLCAVRAASGRMEQADILAWLKSDCAPLEQDACDLLENYVLLWDLSGERWQQEWVLHPRGFGYELDEDDRQTLAMLNSLREVCISPLIALRTAMQNGDTVGQYVQAVYDFLCRTHFSERLERRLSRLEADGLLQLHQVTRQLYELLLHALEQLYAVQYSIPSSPEEFVRLLEILLSQYQVGAIPGTLDAVIVGTPDQLQHRASRQLYLCGCVDGSFPPVSSGGSLLNETERSRLRQAGVVLAPDENQQMDRAMVSAYATLCAPSEKLFLSAAGEQRAYLFDTLCKLYPDALQTVVPSPDDATVRTLGLYLARGGKAASPPEEAIAYRDWLHKAADYDFGGLSEKDVQGLYGSTLHLSASRIDRYAACRFSFFLQDGLKAKERKAASFDAPIYGTFVHYVLEQTLREVKQLGGMKNISDVQLQGIADVHMKDYLTKWVDPVLLASPRLSYLLHRNFTEVSQVVQVLGDELRQSRFIPTDFELTFAPGQPLPPVEIHTPRHNASISGAVDRVDLFEEGGYTFFRVIDYKTGKKSFDYTELLERRGLQMLIYLFALQKNGTQYYGKALHPAGVLYVPARDSLLYLSQRPPEGTDTQAERLGNHRRKGLIMNDTLLLQAMEPSGEEQPKLLPYKLKKDGPDGDLMDLAQLSMLKRYVNRELEALTDEIYAGSVTPNPYFRGTSGACSYCPYESACHPDLCRSTPRSLSSTGAKEFWAHLAQKEAQHG